MTKIRTFFAASLAFSAALATSSLAGAPVEPQPGDHIKLVGNFAKKGKDSGVASTEVSGLACAQLADGSRTCLAIDDEARAAQYFTFDGKTMTPGATVPLIDKKSAGSIRGTPPTGTDCPQNNPDDKAEFKDIDGEAVAYDGKYFYVVGSHGCSRKNGKFTLSSFVTARFEPGKAGSKVETTYRLADALAKADPKTFGKKLGPDMDGMNLEGIVVSNGMLYAGLRAPSGPNSLIVAVEIEALFKEGSTPYDGKLPPPFKLPLKANVGIRDLSLLPAPDGRLLVLTGPTGENKTENGDVTAPYSVYAANLSNPVKLKHLADIKVPDGAKAEGILSFGETKDALPVVIVFDSLGNGQPTEYRLPLSK